MESGTSGTVCFRLGHPKTPYRRVNTYDGRQKVIKIIIMEKKEKKTKKNQFINMPVLNGNAAGIDIGGSMHAVAVPLGRDEVSVRTFGAMTCDLKEIIAWLQKCNVDTVAMESTGVYWKPLYAMLVIMALKSI